LLYPILVTGLVIGTAMSGSNAMLIKSEHWRCKSE
jgi:hypothetical protein